MICATCNPLGYVVLLVAIFFVAIVPTTSHAFFKVVLFLKAGTNFGRFGFARNGACLGKQGSEL